MTPALDEVSTEYGLLAEAVDRAFALVTLPTTFDATTSYSPTSNACAPAMLKLAAVSPSVAAAGLL